MARAVLVTAAMRPYLPLALFALLSLASATPSHADVGDQLDRLTDAVRDQGGRCARTLLPELREVRLHLQEDEYDQATRQVKKLEHRADAWCGREVRRGLHHLREALEHPSNDGDDDQPPPPPPPVETFTATSTVDMPCLRAAKEAYPYEPDRDVLASWLATCRTGAFADADCSNATWEANPTCEAAATQAYPYVADDATTAAIQSGCRTEHCALPRAGRTVSTHVDLTCFSQRQSEYPYAPDADRIAGWLDGCRSALPAATCKPLRSHHDDACFQAARRAYPYQLSNELELRLLAGCKIVDQQCE